jgi:2-polyprenyl-3-methyl-5-hydroxy-6-metoxy-1,4-benzoquinol methylase
MSADPLEEIYRRAVEETRSDSQGHAQAGPGRALAKFVARSQRPIARYLAASDFRRKFGGRLISKIAAEDDLLHESIAEVSQTHSKFRYYRAVSTYYLRGESNVSAVDNLLVHLGSPLRESDSVLEFACGYGRLTRHFVRRISPSKLTVSDIDQTAVDFVRQSFGVEGFYSSREPEKLIHDRRYALIIVVSLFSHLSAERWPGWLRRLEEMLKPQGLLVFSTLPWHTAGGPVPDEEKEAFELGFLYSGENETRGRLGGEEYGTAFVTKDFVTKAVSDNLTAGLVNYSPRALNGVQDVYVLQRGDA